MTKKVIHTARVILVGVPLLLASCGSTAPPPSASPATLAAAPGDGAKSVKRSPWPNSRFFAPKAPAPAPLFTRPRRPTRGPAVHTLRS